MRCVPQFGNQESGIAALLGGNRGEGQVENRDRKEPEVAVLDAHGLFNSHRRGRRIEFPNRVTGFADRQPRFVDAIGIFVEPIRFFRFEIERIGADKERRRGAPLHGERPADMMKGAAAGAQFVARVVGFHVLRRVIELHVALRDDDLGFAVIFDVVGAKPRVLVAHVHMAIGVEDFPYLALLVRFERGLAPARERRERFLRGGLAP